MANDFRSEAERRIKKHFDAREYASGEARVEDENYVRRVLGLLDAPAAVAAEVPVKQ